MVRSLKNNVFLAIDVLQKIRGMCISLHGIISLLGNSVCILFKPSEWLGIFSSCFDTLIKFLIDTLFRSSCPEIFCIKGVPRNFTKFTGKQLCQSLFFNKVARLWYRCFPVNFAKLLRTPFFTEHLRWLLLTFAPLSLQY